MHIFLGNSTINKYYKWSLYLFYVIILVVSHSTRSIVIINSYVKAPGHQVAVLAQPMTFYW